MSDYDLKIWFAVSIPTVLLLILGFVLYQNKSDEQTIQDMYISAKSQPYVTITNAKNIISRANKHGDLSLNHSNSIIDKLDGSTVVDNSNGHEYIITINNVANIGNNFEYKLTPVMNNKNAMINKQWQKSH